MVGSVAQHGGVDGVPSVQGQGAPKKPEEKGDVGRSDGSREERSTVGDREMPGPGSLDPFAGYGVTTEKRLEDSMDVAVKLQLKGADVSLRKKKDAIQATQTQKLSAASRQEDAADDLRAASGSAVGGAVVGCIMGMTGGAFGFLSSKMNFDSVRINPDAAGFKVSPGDLSSSLGQVFEALSKTATGSAQSAQQSQTADSKQDEADANKESALSSTNDARVAETEKEMELIFETLRQLAEQRSKLEQTKDDKMRAVVQIGG